MTKKLSPAPEPYESESPPWSRTTKVIVAVITLLLIALIAQRFQTLIAQLIVAAMLAYILNPIISFVDKHTALNRTTVVLLVYALLAAGIVGAMVALGVAAYNQVTTFIDQIPRIIAETTAFFAELTARREPIVFGPFTVDPVTIDWNAITNQLLNLVEPAVSRGGQALRQLATATVRWLGYMFFVFVLSIYFAVEIPRLGEYVAYFAQQPGYRKDAERLMREFGRIWRAYLRGQVILGLVIGVAVWLGLSVLGVQNALALGLLSGLLEFIPVIGPFIGAGTAVVVAFFQPANYLGLPAWQYALIVLALMILIQQIENNILVPRIVGESLDLHPLVVMVAVFMGGSLAGILGAILAAPITATLKLLGLYAWRKMFDLPPFPTPEPEESPPKPSLLGRTRQWVWQQVRRSNQ
ncbi:MAG: AI-2E family transporter [Chloroflexi bacterium]|nr:MAG: AI-2E family transporter [Chloroflexota bacterium]